METGVDPQVVINWGAGSLLALIGWLGKSVWDAVNELKKDLHVIEIDLPKNYVSKVEYLDTMKSIKDALQRIEDKLDDKVDKP